MSKRRGRSLPTVSCRSRACWLPWPSPSPPLSVKMAILPTSAPGDLYLPLVFKGAGPDACLDGALDAQGGCPRAPPGFVVNVRAAFSLSRSKVKGTRR